MKHILATLTLLSSVLVHSSHAQTTTPAKPGELVNGDFSQRVGTGLPTGWSFTKTPWIDARKKEPKIPDGMTVTTLQEGSKAIVRITYKDNQRGCLVQVLEIPPRAKEARFKVTVRGEPDKEDEKMAFPDAGFRFFNAAGKYLPERKSSDTPKTLSDKSWREIEFKCDIPAGATFCNVILGNVNNTNGIFEFRGASVKFR
jgi:hypothetical protein